jgi:predicted XRE-type DNA-binding protein
MEFVRTKNPFLSSSETQEIAIEKHYRAQLMASIRNILNKKGLNQRQAAELLGIPQPRVSDIVNGKVSACSVEKLLTHLYKLGIELSFEYADNGFSTTVLNHPVKQDIA